MTASAFSIRNMSRDELGLALDWAAEEGWNPGFDDAEPFHAADPGGFFLGELGGEPVAVSTQIVPLVNDVRAVPEDRAGRHPQVVVARVRRRQNLGEPLEVDLLLVLHHLRGGDD